MFMVIIISLPHSHYKLFQEIYIYLFLYIYRDIINLVLKCLYLYRIFYISIDYTEYITKDLPICTHIKVSKIEKLIHFINPTVCRFN